VTAPGPGRGYVRPMRPMARLCGGREHVFSHYDRFCFGLLLEAPDLIERAIAREHAVDRGDLVFHDSQPAEWTETARPSPAVELYEHETIARDAFETRGAQAPFALMKCRHHRPADRQCPADDLELRVVWQRDLRTAIALLAMEHDRCAHGETSSHWRRSTG